ncbi:MAG: DUF5348 domain-containing protein [Anaerovoracaceae bacterium]|jgi:hypothetical protein
MHKGTLTVNMETGMYEVLLEEFDESIPLFHGDEFLIMIDGQWKDTKIIFSETEDDWVLDGININDWGIGSTVKVKLLDDEE